MYNHTKIIMAVPATPVDENGLCRLATPFFIGSG
ncbi:MAG: hypothetical protein QOH66_3056 [Actinomycetota bacterium]|jgi:hypothetical protein|nr:hypothetical protein [Actinomycetota bacterium]